MRRQGAQGARAVFPNSYVETPLNVDVEALILRARPSKHQETEMNEEMFA